MAKSTFYRNSRFTRRTLPDGVKCETLVFDKLPLRTFDGDVREYNEFRDDFINLIELQPHLSPFQKLQHLLTHLEGAPLLAAEGFGICNEAYWEVLDILEAHYGDNVVIQNVLRKDFVNMQPPTERPADLLKFHDEVVKLTRRFNRCGIDVDNKHLYCRLLLGHLPLPLRIKLIQSYGCRGTKKVSCVLDALRQYLSDIKEAEEHALSLKEPCKQAKDTSVLDHHQSGHEDIGAPHTSCEGRQQDTPSESDVGSVMQSVETAVNVVNDDNDDRLQERQTCPLCGLLHQAANCFMYSTIQTRLRRVLKLKICLLCLREGHLASVCSRRTKRSCKTCGHGQHHRILCKDADGSSRRKTLRSSQMRTTTGPSGDPERSDPKRRFRTKSVIRNVTSRVTSAITLRQGTQRSSSTRCKSNPKTNRKKRTRNYGASSKGRAGTAQPSTTSSDESMKHQTAKASGNRRHLPARHGQLQTDPRSKTNESAKFQREQRDAEEDSSMESSEGYSDDQQSTLDEPHDSVTLHQYSRNDKLYPARWEPYYPSDDDVSMPSSHGHCSNADPDNWEDGDDLHSSPEDSSYVACASTDEQTTLLECIKATAENPTTGDSREVLIFFDSGSTRSFVSRKVAHDLSLPRQPPSSLRVHTFGSELSTTIEGFSTSIVLCSKHRRLPPLAVIAGECIVPSVRTALVESEDLPKLRWNGLLPYPVQLTPDILIGQDLVSNFKRRYGSTLPSGFYVVHSILGPMLGGSGKVPNTVSEATTSPRAARSACAASQLFPQTGNAPHSTKLPTDQRRKHTPAHSVGTCKDTASTSNSTHTFETDQDAPSNATDRDFSPRVEENEFNWSPTSASRCSARHILSGRTAEPQSSRKPINPLDTTAPFSPPNFTTHVMLQQGLRMDLEVPTAQCNAPDRRSRSSFPRNPTLFQSRKTQLRHRSSSSDRQALGIRNQGELRKCDAMQTLQDQLRPAISTPALAVPDDFDSVQKLRTTHHVANSTIVPCPESDTVLVASVDSPKDTARRSSHSPARHIALDAVMPNSPVSDGARPATRTPTHSVGTRTELPQLQSALLAGSAYGHTTEPQTTEDHETDCQRSRTNQTCHRLHDDISRRTAEFPALTHSVGYGTEAVAPPPSTHSAVLEQAVDTAKSSQANREHNAPKPAHGQSSRTPIGSNQHPTSSTRRVTTHSQGHRKPCIASQDACATTTDRAAIPIIDGFVSKSYAALQATFADEAYKNPAVAEDLPPQYKCVGYINHLGVPSSYLPTDLHPVIPSSNTPLARVRFEQLAQEDDILPWKHILGSTLGALPPYWEMATSEMFLHLHEEAQGATYRGMSLCGVGPTGFFLNADCDYAHIEYEGQRQALLRFGRIARNTGKCIVLVVYDEPKTGMDLHNEAIKLLYQEVQLRADHPIHLVAYRASTVQLQVWLATFSNVVFGVEHTHLTSLILALRSTTDRTESYVHAHQLQELFSNLPLTHFALHSGCPSPHPSEHPGHFQTPTILLRTAELFEQLTGTPKDILLEHSARNLLALYRLNIELPTRANTASHRLMHRHILSHQPQLSCPML